MRYQVRYSASFQPPAAARASQPEATPKNVIPIAQTSWNGCRRSRHWSSRATAITRARRAVSVGQQDGHRWWSFVGPWHGGRRQLGDQAGIELVVVAVQPVAQPVARRRAVGPGDRDRAHDLAHLALPAEQEVAGAHPRRGRAPPSPWNSNGPGLIGGRSAHETGVSAATTSRMFIRHGVPSMTSRQPSHRIDTLSSMIVGMWTPR